MRRRRGFTIIDLVVTLAVAAMLGLVLVGLMADARRNAGLGQSIANLKRFGDGIRAYALENDDRFPAYTWSATEGHSEDPDLEAQRLQGSTASSAAQAVDILRRLSGYQNMPPFTGWIPQARFAHLPLLEFLGSEFPARWTASPGDELLVAWQRDPFFDDIDPPHYEPFRRLPYQSSYEAAPTWWAPEELADLNAYRVRQGTSHGHWQVSILSVLTGRRLNTCAFPSEKAMMWDVWQWYHGPRIAYWAHAEARVPILSADGHVSVRTTGEANPGWLPVLPESPGTTSFYYAPFDWEPPEFTDGRPDWIDAGRIRWTRGGALGRDFDGPEIDTGQL
ncbi:MAG: type II secretion system protein [Phycisphaeraceae bacterium]|nr:type II secretion system protein [Phycisphaeraceae bacterium]